LPISESGRVDTDPVALAPKSSQPIVVDREGYDAVIAGQRGKVVLVDFWATWCGPCVEQLPHTIELAERFATDGLSVVTVSFDDPEGSQRVSELLRTKGADRLTNLISRYGASPRSMEAFEIESGAVPHYKLYDRGGRLIHTFAVDPLENKQFTLSDIDAATEELVRE
jgi:thiol-disulfide isomerase/thioredoxin